MLLLQVVALTLALGPSLASAAIFPRDTRVKMLDGKSFKKAMKRNETSVVAFVAPWCGHCQRMAPEYSKAALGLHPLVPLYAVDCDVEGNKRLCSEQGVQGFPTVKLFPRGSQKPAVTFNSGERTANSFFYWASRLVPSNDKKLAETKDVSEWSSQKTSRPRVLLLNKDKKVPLMWQVLSNKYGKDMEFGSHHDRKSKTFASLGFENGGKKSSKIVVYPAGSTDPALYEGPNKHEYLTQFFNSVLDGTADLKVVRPGTKEEETDQPAEDEFKNAPQETEQAVFESPSQSTTFEEETTSTTVPSSSAEDTKTGEAERPKDEL